MTNPAAWHPHPDVWLLLVALSAGYVLAIRRLGPRLAPAGAEPVARSQIVSFCLGLGALIIAADWPVHDVAEGSLYSVHMVQHMLLSMAMPSLLLMGTPSWLFRALLRPPAFARLARIICRPFPALVVFNLVLVLTHWPAVVTLTVHSELFHLATHIVLVGSALVMWMPVLSPVMEIPRLALPGQMLYLFLQSLVPTVPASFLTFGRAPLYHVYETLPKLWGVSAMTDQRVAGLIMKILGGMILWTIIAVLFFKWYAIEREEGVDVLEWRDVDRDVNRMELSR